MEEIVGDYVLEIGKAGQVLDSFKQKKKNGVVYFTFRNIVQMKCFLLHTERKNEYK